MQCPPQNEGPAGAVPEAAQEHGGHQVPQSAGPPPPVASQTDVEVVPQPGRQADVPALPEVPEAERPVRLVEVHREAEAQQQGDPDGNVAVAAEVAVDLQRVSVDSQQGLEAGGAARVGKHPVDQAGGQHIGQDHLLEEAAEDQARGPPGVDRRPVVRGQLCQEVTGPHDRTGHQLGEEADEQGEVEEFVRRLQDATVYVERIRHRLEGVEADAHREDDPQWSRRDVQPQVAEQVHEGLHEEVGVLEEAQHPEVRAQAAPQVEAATAPVGCGVYCPAGHEVHDGGDPDEREEPPVPPPVEGIAGQQHGRLPGRRPLQQHGVHRQHERQEDGEGDRGEQHGRRRVCHRRSPGPGWAGVTGTILPP